VIEVNGGEGKVGKKGVSVDLRLVRCTGKCGRLMTGVFLEGEYIKSKTDEMICADI